MNRNSAQIILDSICREFHGRNAIRAEEAKQLIQEAFISGANWYKEKVIGTMPNPNEEAIRKEITL